MKLDDAARKLNEDTEGMKERLQTTANGAWNSVQHRADGTFRASANYVREHPWSTVLAVAGFGLVLGLLANRCALASSPRRK